MYRPTLAIDAIGLDSPEAIEIAMANLADVLMALVSINRRYIRIYPDRIPLLYESGVRYDRLEPDGDACGDDDFQDVVTILEHPRHPGLGDCFPRGTLLLRDDYELVPIEEIRVGDRIWGRDDWTTVEATKSKGLLSVDAMMMNNGSVVRLTGEHHVYVARCPIHVDCECPIEQRPIGRVRLREVVSRDVLVQPREHPFGPAYNARHELFRSEARTLRAESLHRDVAEVPCYDVQTSDHYVYLPEHDVTVSNCDDLAAWRVAELNERYGIEAVPFIRLYADRVSDGLAIRPRHLYHIQVRWPEGLPEYPETVYRDPEFGVLIEDPSKDLGMHGEA